MRLADDALGLLSRLVAAHERAALALERIAAAAEPPRRRRPPKAPEGDQEPVSDTDRAAARAAARRMGLHVRERR